MDPFLDFIATIILCALAFGALGLWWGERGRRIAAERWKVHGNPEAAPPAARIEQPISPEERAANLGVSEESINRGADELQRMAKDANRPMSRKEALAQARMMLHQVPPADMGGL